VKPLPKEITSEIRTILEECRDGKRLHRQESYATKTSCGTAHCIAGWKVHKDMGYRVKYVPYDSSHAIDLDMQLEDDCDFDAWEYAKSAWQLTTAEATTLFDSNSTYEGQFGLLEILERGNRQFRYN
jgi:hypothetical protein